MSIMRLLRIEQNKWDCIYSYNIIQLQVRKRIYHSFFIRFEALQGITKFKRTVCSNINRLWNELVNERLRIDSIEEDYGGLRPSYESTLCTGASSYIRKKTDYHQEDMLEWPRPHLKRKPISARFAFYALPSISSRVSITAFLFAFPERRVVYGESGASQSPQFEAVFCCT